jgi:hypothetical protein
MKTLTVQEVEENFDDIPGLEDFEVKAFELLSEKLAYYFRNEKLNSIGV